MASIPFFRYDREYPSLFISKASVTRRAKTYASRAIPTQARAMQSVDKILATAAGLLDEVGLEGFNTNLLAQRAGVRIRTVYRYFPDKYGVILALTKSLSEQWWRWDQEMFDRLSDPRSDWKQVLREARIQWLKNAHRVPGALSVLAAMNATPELGELHFQIAERESRGAAAALKRRGLQLPPSRLLSIARTIVISMTTAVDLHLRLRGKDARGLIRELDINMDRYLDPYFPSISPRRRR